MARQTYGNYFQATHYTLYWRLTDEERLDLNAKREARYATSNLLKRVKPSDVLWIINIHLGRLYLIGHIKVALVTDDSTLAQEVARPEKEWVEDGYFAVADSRDVEPLRYIDISERIPDLQFVGAEVSPKFPPDAMQFRQLRELSMESAELLNGIWYAHQDSADSIKHYVDDYLELTEDDRAYNEGRLVTRSLHERQRNRTLVKDAKERSRRKYGKLICEVCGFDFVAQYGIEYIEAHHAQQVASFTGERLTYVDELHMLCANCHRMVHMQTPPLSVEELKTLISKHRGQP